MKKFSSFLIFCLLVQSAHCQFDYRKYNRSITQADSLILDSAYAEALSVMKQLRNDYQFIYVRHCVKALQLSIATKDSIETSYWLQRSVLGGVPLWMLRQSKMTSFLFSQSPYKEIISHAYHFRNTEMEIENSEYRKKIDALMVIDQKKTYRVNNGFILFRHTVYGIQWLRNNKKQLNTIKDSTLHHGFPGEMLIGLGHGYEDSVANKRYFKRFGPSPKEMDAYIMLIHTFSWPNENIDSLLFKELLAGRLEAYQYASLMDFISEYGKRKTTNYYNEWHFDPDKSHSGEINRRRLSIGLPSLTLSQNINQEISRRKKNYADDFDYIVLY